MFSVILGMAACSVASHVSQSEAPISKIEEDGDSVQQILQQVALPEQDTIVRDTMNVEKLDSLPEIPHEEKEPLRDSIFVPVKQDSVLQDSVVRDSTVGVVQQDSVGQDSVPPPLFNDIVTYSADDSIKLSVPTKEMFLYKNGYVKYITTELTADSIAMNMGTNIIYATGMVDSAGGLTSKPVFRDNGQEYESSSMMYNFKTEKGYIKNVITQQGEGYVQARLTKKMDESIFNLKDGIYTTCDNHEHPHFYIRMSKAKLIKDKKVVSGFANIYLEDVPLPLAIPFGFFPITKKGTSGVLIPTYGEERMRGFNLRDGGYYWYISDYIDMALTGTIYTNGSWSANLTSTYRKRYKFSGNVNMSISRNHTGQKGTPDYTQSKDWSVRWSHTQDAKANPYTTFSASVDMSSSTNNYYQNTTNINDIANQRKQSSISWSKKWPDRPFSITASFTHNQNSTDTTISLSFPNVNFRMSQVYPFRKKERAGKMKWYENIGITYSAELKNTLQTKEYLLMDALPHIAKDWNNGFRHSIPLSISFNLVKDLSLTPSINYEGVAYLSSIRRGDWVVDSTMSGYGYNPVDTIYGLHYAHDYSTSLSLSYSPTIYGMYQFRPHKKIHAIRHVLSPSATISYVPNFGVNPDKYYKTYVDRNGNEQRYSIFEGKVYGTPTSSERAQQSGSLRLSIDNNVEMKVRNDADSTGTEEFKKVKLLESFSLSSTYDFFADSMRWSTISLSARTKIFNNKVNINLSGTLDPYALNVQGQRINKYHGGIGRLTRVSASSGIQFSADNGKKKEEKDPILGGRYDEYLDFEVPWSISLDYTFSFSKSYSPNTEPGATKPLSENTISQMLRINGNLSLTPKWKFSFSTGYDFQQKEVTSTNFNLTRDLHCWEMTFSCIPFGTHQSYNFQINVRSSMLRDLKLTKKDSWYDRSF